MSVSRLQRIAIPTAALLAAAPLAAATASSSSQADGTKCRAISGPAVNIERAGTGTGSTGTSCVWRATVDAGYQAQGGFAIHITRAGKKVYYGAKNGHHCGAIGAIRKGDWVDASSESSSPRVSWLKAGPDWHC